MSETSERVAYVNGAIVPESEAKISIHDLGFIYGDAVFDTARTFEGRIFRLEEHVDRLFESLAYVRIDPGLDKQQIIDATQEVVSTNLPKLREGEDYWVTQRVSGGRKAFDGEAPLQSGATVVIESVPLPLRARARLFQEGIHAVLSPRRRIAPDALSPNTKTNNYLNMMLAQREVDATCPGGWALMADRNGDLAEGAGANLFVVKDGVVHTPTTEFVLNGVSRQEAISICREIGLELSEGPVSLKLAMSADEMFFTSTSLCVCPVSKLNGRRVGPTARNDLAGPATTRIMSAFKDRVGMDFVAQYLRFADEGGAGVGL